jgi:hypothetical protein
VIRAAGAPQSRSSARTSAARAQVPDQALLRQAGQRLELDVTGIR